MGRDEWFRNTEWSSDIEASFFARLKRARAAKKLQYLRLQAYHLITTHPAVSVALLDDYFARGADGQVAAAGHDMAKARLELGEVEPALTAFENALEAERKFPNFKTHAYLDFVVLIAMAQLKDRYEAALRILEENAVGQIFAVAQFEARGAQALILADMGRRQEGRKAAVAALEVAAKTHSGLRYHPQVGLVESIDTPFGRRIAQVARAD